MLAKIRFYDKGIGSTLPKLIDLERFSEEEIRQRMVDYGHDYDSELLIVAIDDWNIQRTLTLDEAYSIRNLVRDVYVGDEFLVCHLLQKQLPVSEILSLRYVFLSKDEEECMVKVSKYYEADALVHLFFKMKTWGNFMCAFIVTGHILNTSRGFYFKVK
ncbi:TPA: hypothetical protein U1C81_000550 [Streptococcus suis]|nr:hypothetical protein [Streptococcus suis]HEM3666818.1 hypothetical protein [Streptococcus suis]HEM3720794.1 hypothetical protein [Streptococcus suis]